MTINNRQFIDALVDSGALQADAARGTISGYRQAWKDQRKSGILSDSDNDTDADSNGLDSQFDQEPASALANWMVAQKSLTTWQATVLLAGRGSSLTFGNYIATTKIKSGPLAGCFEAVHHPTGHPVLLSFVAGSQTEDLEIWKSIKQLANATAAVNDPHLVDVYEPVTLPEYRFLVSARPTGKCATSLVGRKARMPWKDAVGVCATVASALSAIHENGIVHGSLTPDSIWIHPKTGAALRLSTGEQQNETAEVNGYPVRLDYLAPELHDGEPPTKPGDAYALGCLMFRLLSGRRAFPGENQQQVLKAHRSEQRGSLAKYELANELEELLDSLLSKTPSERPSLKQAATQLNQLVPEAKSTREMEPAEKNYRKWLASRSVSSFAAVESDQQQSVPDSPIVLDTSANAAPVIVDSQTAPSMSSGTSGLSGKSGSSGTSAPSAAIRNSKNKWITPVVIAASCLALLLGAGGIAMWMGSTPVAEVTPTEDDSGSADDQSNTGGGDNGTDNGGTDGGNGSSGAVTPPLTAPVRIRQNLVEDDRAGLWETPTEGANVNFAWLPGGSRMIYVFRPSGLLQQPEGEPLLRSLGPVMNSRIAAWQTRAGTRLAEIDQLIISLHSNGLSYDPYFIVRLDSPVSTAQLKTRWSGSAPRRTEGGNEILVSGGIANFPIDAGDGANATGFISGPLEIVQEMVDAGGNSSMSGTFHEMRRWTDRDRHFTMLFQRQALFNQEGQWLMNSMTKFNRELSVNLPQSIRGGAISLHVDNGSYFEFVFDQTVEIKPQPLKTSLEDYVRAGQQNLVQFINSVPADAHWQRVKQQLPFMLREFYRSLRWDVEYGKVVANCWQPPMAAHNLIAASELLTTFTSGAGSIASTGSGDSPPPSAPASYEDLLAKTRNLNLATNPDLIVITQELETEIREDYPGLPFSFGIRIIGKDLEQDGITKNQRPGAFEVNNRPFADILTELMVRCSSGATEASSPECKLVWVVGDDPDNPGQKAILITTRTGAEQKNLELPAAFRLDP